MKVRADQDGITVPPRMSGAFDVLFGGEPVWSFTLDGRHWRSAISCAGPASCGAGSMGTPTSRSGRSGRMTARRRREIDLGRVRFGAGQEPVRLVDGEGRPVVIDKWGIVQRPFSSRGEDVTHELGERTRRGHGDPPPGLRPRGVDGVRHAAGRRPRGQAIGHDSDSDLLYLSEKTTPAEINLEAYEIKRAFTRRGLVATLKSGSFVTVLFPGPDGAPLGIDVYACFYVGGVLHETATLREPIPREAILPLTTLPYEGLELPAPADPARLLAASYGPGWQVPDPSFRHEPDDGTVARFEGWFGNMMTARRGWESWWHDRQEIGEASELAERVMADHPEPVSVWRSAPATGPTRSDGGAGPPSQRLRLRPPLLPRGAEGDPRGGPADPVRPLQPLRPARHDDPRCAPGAPPEAAPGGAGTVRAGAPPPARSRGVLATHLHLPAVRAVAPTWSSPTRTTPTVTTPSGSTRCASRSTPTTYDAGWRRLGATDRPTPTGRKRPAPDGGKQRPSWHVVAEWS